MAQESNPFVVNLSQAAREMRERWGKGAAQVALERAEQAQADGDGDAARGWREIARALASPEVD